VMDYLGRLAQLQRLVIVDNVQFNPSADVTTSGTSGGAGSSGSGGTASAGSTGPFSGGTQVTVTIQARMFESAAAVDTTGGTAASTGTPTAAGTTTVTAPALNNS